MKFATILLLTGIAALSGCSTTANNGSNGNNANLRGQNTNTAYVTNSDTNVKPTVPANATNISPGNLPSMGNTTNTNRGNSNTNANANRRP